MQAYPTPGETEAAPTVARGAIDRPAVPLLATKLGPPPLGHPTVARGRLLTALAEGVQRTPLTLLSGPAGSGKTVLASSWLGQAAPAAGWLGLDEADDEPATFWSYVLEALARVGVDTAGLPRPVSDWSPDPAFLGLLGSRLLAGPDPVVLILDNADCLTDQRIAADLDLLLRLSGTGLRLVLCARADPLLPLHRYRVAGTLTEIRFDQLAFTTEETEALYALLGVPVPAPAAAALRERTLGWAVGLRLAVFPLMQGMDPQQLVRSLAEEDGGVAQYLVAEVLNRQPDDLRADLLRISVTDELEPGLVDRLVGGHRGRHVLAELARRGAFVEKVVSAPGGYRIHALFRELLVAQLRFDDPAEARRLHRICAGWFTDAGRVPEAVRHAVSAEDWELASSVLVDDLAVGRMLGGDRDPALAGLDAMPEELPSRDAAVIRAARAISQGREAAATDAAAVAAAAEDAGSRPSLRVSAAVTRAAAGALGASAAADAPAHAEVAAGMVNRLPEERRRERRELSTVLSASEALARLRTDAPDTVLAAALRAALHRGLVAGARRLRAVCLGSLALLEALGGHLSRAVELAREAEAAYVESGSVEPPAAAAVALAWVALDRYELADIRRLLARARAAAEDDPLVAPLAAVVLARFLRVRRDLAAAEQALAGSLADREQPRWVREQVVAEAVRLRLDSGRHPAAEDVVAELDGSPRAALLRATVLGSAVPAGPTADDADLPLDVRVGQDVLRAFRALDGTTPDGGAAGGGGGVAVVALDRALRRAEGEALRLPFLEAPPGIRRLLRVHPQLSRAGEWLSPSAEPSRRTDRAAAATTGRPARVVTEQLSPRECEVLGHVAEMMSTAEIAAAMFVSVNTVRTHMRSILRKLNVSGRSAAVRRARELGIL